MEVEINVHVQLFFIYCIGSAETRHPSHEAYVSVWPQEQNAAVEGGTLQRTFNHF